MKNLIILISVSILSIIAAIITDYSSLMYTIDSNDLSINHFDYLTYFFILVSIVYLILFLYEVEEQDKIKSN